MKVTLKVKGMHCRSCEVLLGDVLSWIKGTGNVKIDYTNGKVMLDVVDSSVLPRVIEAIRSEGYEVG
ncbi:MAG: heavy metal-associated domain-containing protein [Candidatus Bilamarchaeaceae archaeon]